MENGEEGEEVRVKEASNQVQCGKCCEGPYTAMGEDGEEGQC